MSIKLTQGPTESRDVDHGNGTSTGTLVLARQGKVVHNSKLGNSGKERSDVDHCNGLECDTSQQSTLSADDIDQEEGADESGSELDKTKDGGDQERLLGTSNAKKAEQIGSVEGDGTGARPLREELNHGGQVESVQVAGNGEHLLELAHDADTLGGLELMVQSSLNGGDMSDNVLALDGLLAKTGQDGGGLVWLALLDEEARRLGLEEAEDEDDARHHDVQAGGDEPSVVRVLLEVDGAAIVGEVGEDDTEVDGTGEDTSTQASNGSGSHFSNVDGTVMEILVTRFGGLKDVILTQRRESDQRRDQR